MHSVLFALVVLMAPLYAYLAPVERDRTQAILNAIGCVAAGLMIQSFNQKKQGG